MNGISFVPESASTTASRVDNLFLFELAIAAIFVIGIFGTIIYFTIRYARRSENEIPPVQPKHTTLEVTWTLGPFCLMLIMFFWGARLYVDAKKPLDHGLEINIVGKQWMWKIQHPDGIREINELHVPVGEPVKLILTSEDVIHDFAMPAFRLKQDVLPGCYVTQWFTATRPGKYDILCSQYCGTDHSKMVGQIIALQPSDYAAWRAGIVPTDAPAAAGQKLFVTYGCSGCHGQRAPSLAGLYNSQQLMQDGSVITADESYLRKSIVDPSAQIVAGYPPMMPAYKGTLSEEQLFQLISYIKSLETVRNTAAPGALPDPLPAPSTQPAPGGQPKEIHNFPPAERPYPVNPSSFRN